MRVRLRYVLPAAQMLVALGLYRWSDVWFETLKAHHEVLADSPAFTLLVSLNAPLAIMRVLYYRHVSELWDRVVFVLAVGLLWYWVALSIESWRANRTLVTFSWAPLRLAADLLMLALGAFWGLSLIFQGHQMYLELVAFSSWLWVPGVFASVLAWSLALIYFPIRDFVQRGRARARPT